MIEPRIVNEPNNLKTKTLSISALSTQSFLGWLRCDFLNHFFSFLAVNEFLDDVGLLLITDSNEFCLND